MAANSRHDFERMAVLLLQNELHGPQLLETAGCLVITIEHFS